jgi:hypothetical protein
MKRTNHPFFSVSSLKASPSIQRYSQWIHWFLLHLVGRKREKEGKGKIHLPAWGLLNGLPCAGWWRVRERQKKERKKFVLSERYNGSFRDLWSIPLYLESLNTGPFNLFPSDFWVFWVISSPNGLSLPPLHEEGFLDGWLISELLCAGERG